MNTHEDLDTLRRYTRAEAAQKLNIPDSWLKRWVTQRVVPHQRSGQPGPRQRGVWFTHDDILAIGRMLPGLMTTRQGNQRAEAPGEEACLEGAALAGAQHAAGMPAAVPAELLAELAGLRSLRATG